MRNSNKPVLERSGVVPQAHLYHVARPRRGVVLVSNLEAHGQLAARVVEQVHHLARPAAGGGHVAW